ncbi:MAG: glycosyltransferase, partial [Candidatus Baltobacteraceae bacterium]
DAVIVPTQTMEHHLRALGVSSRIAVVPSGIDVEFFARGERRDDVRARFGVGPDERMVLSVGRLGREKNLELVLAAFANLEDSRAKLVIVGDGPHRVRLEELAANAGIGARTCFAGELPRDALPDIYAGADAFIFTSRSETQGLVLAEALAAGSRVVAVDTPQTRDVLAGAGSVVSEDPVALARALSGALAWPRAGPGREVAARFERRAIAADVLALYGELLATQRAG